jgi:UDPglucose 6-dehydrogenase
VRVVSELLKKGAKVSVYDPEAMVNARHVLGGTVEYAKTALECIEKADCCIIATEWKEFTKIPAKKFVELMQSPIIIDGKRLLDPSRFRRGIKYAAIGHARRQ